METCTALRRDGRRCQAQPLPDSEQCWAHDTRLAEKRRQALAAGGRNRARAARARKLLPASLRPVLDTLITAIDECHGGTITPAQAGAMAALAGAIVRVYQGGTLEERVRELEAAAASRSASGGTRGDATNLRFGPTG